MAAIALRRSVALSAGADAGTSDSVVADAIDCEVTVMLRSSLKPVRRADPMFLGPGVGQVSL